MQNLSSNISTQALFTKGETFGKKAEEACNGTQATVKEVLTSASITKHCTLTLKRRYVD